MARNGRRNADTSLVAALAAGQTQTDAAQRAGVSLRTVARRMNEPDFRQAVMEARAGFISQATGRLAEATTRAADALVELLSDESPTVKLTAARALLDHAGRYVETTDVNERINRIESLLTAQQAALRPVKGGQKWVA